MAPKQDPKPKFQEGERGAGGRLGAWEGKEGIKGAGGGGSGTRGWAPGACSPSGGRWVRAASVSTGPWEREGRARPRPLRRGDCSGRAGGPPGLLSSSSRPILPVRPEAALLPSLSRTARLIFMQVWALKMFKPPGCARLLSSQAQNGSITRPA